MEIDYKKLEEFGITNEDPKWDNDNWLAKKQPTQKRLDISTKTPSRLRQNVKAFFKKAVRALLSTRR